MSKLRGGLRKVCIYNPANGDRVILHKISAQTSLTEEWINSDTPTGNVQGQKDKEYEIHFFDADGAIQTQMEAWEEADTPVCLVLLFTNAVMYELTPQNIGGFIDSKKANARDGVSPFHFNYKLINHDPFAYKGVNFLWQVLRRNAGDKTQFAANTAYKPKLLEGANPGTWRRTGALQIDAGTGEGEFVIPFPFENETVFCQLKEDTEIDKYVVRTLNFAKTQISTTNVDTGNIHPQTMGAGAFWITIQYDATGQHAQPSMRLTNDGFIAV